MPQIINTHKHTSTRSNKLFRALISRQHTSIISHAADGVVMDVIDVHISIFLSSSRTSPPSLFKSQDLKSILDLENNIYEVIKAQEVERVGSSIPSSACSHIMSP